MIRLLADKHIYKLKDFLPEQVELTTFDPDNGLPVSLDGINAVFTRTVTKINESTLPVIPPSLKLVGTASAGSDHFDHSYLSEHGIKTCNAKGCNANAVAEYVITALLIWSETRGIDLNQIKVGVIGVGFTGSAVIEKLNSLNIEHIDYDPPREQSDLSFQSAALDDILACDILTFHVPLVEHGKFKTRHWLNQEVFKKYSFELVINAARGGIIDEQAFLKAKKTGMIRDYIIDVWENEPAFSVEVAKNAFIATPHIAGYSEQAKLNISKLLTAQLYDLFEIQGGDASYPSPKKTISVKDTGSTSDLLKTLHPIIEYHTDLISLFSKPDKEKKFNSLRVNRPYRFEYPCLELDIEVLKDFPFLEKLGINTPGH